MKKSKRNDIILIVAILVVALASYIGIRYYNGIKTKEPVAVVKVGDEIYGTFPLNQDIVEKIELSDGSYNILEIHDGKADITKASCPDGICVDHRSINKQNETIVCLPNKVVIEIHNGEKNDVDTITN